MRKSLSMGTCRAKKAVSVSISRLLSIVPTKATTAIVSPPLSTKDRRTAAQYAHNLPLCCLASSAPSAVPAARPVLRTRRRLFRLFFLFACVSAAAAAGGAAPPRLPCQPSAPAQRPAAPDGISRWQTAANLRCFLEYEFVRPTRRCTAANRFDRRHNQDLFNTRKSPRPAWR